MAMPTMGPEKEVPLWDRGEGPGSKAIVRASSRSQELNLGSLHHQLGTIMGQSRQQVCPAPVEEVV